MTSSELPRSLDQLAPMLGASPAAVQDALERQPTKSPMADRIVRAIADAELVIATAERITGRPREQVVTWMTGASLHPFDGRTATAMVLGGEGVSELLAWIESLDGGALG